MKLYHIDTFSEDLLFTATELRRILEATTGPLKAMTLLGIDCGLGNSDITTLPVKAVSDGWIDYPRPKTGLPRRCPLWPETVLDLPTRGLVFQPMCVSREFTAVLRDLDLYQEGRSFYSVRHTFRTVADSLPDQAAIDRIMGHTRDDMASHYRHAIDDSRLLAVTEHVREWLSLRSVD